MVVLKKFSVGRPWNLPPIPGVGDLLKLYNIRALKSLSQSFLLSPAVCKVFLNACGSIYKSHVVEIGSGPGGITRALLHGIPHTVYTIEKDNRFRPVLHQMRSVMPDQLNCSWGDIMYFPMDTLLPQEIKTNWDEPFPDIRVVGNLPFNITSPLLFKFMNEISEQTNVWSMGRVPLVLSFQKEVGERIVARPRNYFRSRLSVMCQNWCDCYYKSTIHGRFFVPKVDVDVAIIKFEPRVEPIIKADFKIIEKVVGAIFRSRSKCYPKNLHLLFPKEKVTSYSTKLVELSGVDPAKKAVELTHEEFGKLVYAYITLTKGMDIKVEL